MNVQDLMSPTPAVCTTSDHLSRAAQIMWERDCGAVPVIDAGGKLAGIVTDRDLCMAAYTQGKALHEIPVERVMSKQLFTIGPDMSVEDALQSMARHQVRRLPVVDAEGRLAGILSVADFVRAARRKATRKAVRADELMEALSGVTSARTPEHVAPPPSDLLFPAAPMQAAAARKRASGAKAPAKQPTRPSRRR